MDNSAGYYYSMGDFGREVGNYGMNMGYPGSQMVNVMRHGDLGRQLGGSMSQGGTSNYLPQASSSQIENYRTQVERQTELITRPSAVPQLDARSFPSWMENYTIQVERNAAQTELNPVPNANWSGNHNRPMENQARQMENHNRPMENQARPMENQARPIENHNRPIENQARPMVNPSRQMGANINWTTNHVSQMQSNNRQMETNSRQMDVNARMTEAGARIENNSRPSFNNNYYSVDNGSLPTVYTYSAFPPNGLGSVPTYIPNLYNFNNSVSYYPARSQGSTSYKASCHKTTCKRKSSALPYNIDNEESSSRKVSISCPICFESLVDRHPVSTLCGHLFCKACLEAALKISKTCPKCRKGLPSKQYYHAVYLDS